MFTHPQLQRARIFAERRVHEAREHDEPNYAIVFIMGLIHGYLGKSLLGNAIFAMTALGVGTTLNRVDGRAQRLIHVFAAGILLGDAAKSCISQPELSMPHANHEVLPRPHHYMVVRRKSYS